VEFLLFLQFETFSASFNKICRRKGGIPFFQFETFSVSLNKTFPDAKVTYLTMFPRFVKECCDTHMTKDDVVVIDGIRRDVDKDIVDGIREQDRTAFIMQWWEVIGLDKDMTAEETSDMRVVDHDGVHLTSKANGNAALFICDRLLGLERTRMESGSTGGGVVKRARW
jgi:hypothetical protein